MGAWEKPIDSGEIPDSNTHFDVIVVGSGSAGLAAAIAVAENGARTLMIEKNLTLGGTTA